MRSSKIAAIVLYLYFWFILFGEFILDRATLMSRGYDAVSLIVGILLIVAWFHFDAEDNDIQTSRWLKISVFAFPPAGVLYYKIKYFGWVSALKLIGIFVLLTLILPTLVQLAIWYLTQ